MADTEDLMPTFASQLSKDQLTHLAQKSVARASRKYSAGFMLAALNETDRLSDLQRRQLVEMPDFGEAVASWFGAHLFFSGGAWQRWIERHGSTPCVIESAALRSALAANLFRKLRELMIGGEITSHATDTAAQFAQVWKLGSFPAHPDDLVDAINQLTGNLKPRR
jgi:hypothetical protein